MAVARIADGAGGPAGWRTCAWGDPPPPVVRGRAQLWLMAVDRAPPDATLRALLTQDERSRAERFRFEADRRAFLCAHGLLRVLLAAHLRCAPAAAPIVQPPGEKPVLAPPASLCFNLSHGGRWVLIGLAREAIGVDIEVVRAMPDRDAIARGNFAPAEIAELAALPPDMREDAFFACWTRKEAYVKAVGLGLSAPLDRFAVSVMPEDRAALLDVTDDPGAPARWTMWAGRPATGMWAAAAVAAPGCGFDVVQIGEDAPWGHAAR